MKMFESEFINYENKVEESEIVLKGIAYDENNYDLAHLVDNDDERAAFTNIEVAYVDDKILVGFTDPTRWAIDNVIEGTFKEVK